MKKPILKKVIILLWIFILIFSSISVFNTSADSIDEEGFFLENNSYDLLIITPRYFYKLLVPLKEHKDDLGVTTRIVDLDEVYDIGFWGRDKPEKIKYFIKDAYDNWGIKYVLLVGGLKGQTNSWHLPVRYVSMWNDWEPHIISDLYFADIYNNDSSFSTWDSNGDGKYSQWIKGAQPIDVETNLYPEIAIGRLPCRNKFEVKIMVDKIIYYETTTLGSSWFDDMLVIAGDTYPEINNPLWVGYEGEFYGDLAIENMTGFNPNRLYTSDGSLSHWKDILRTFKNGFGFVYFVGHGSPMSWSNHLPNSHERIESLRCYHLPLFTNRDKLPILVFSGCHINQFDVNIFKYFNKTTRAHIEYVPECIGWWMTRKIGGGSICSIGPTALGFTKEDKFSFDGGINEIEVLFFKSYGQHQKQILGDCWLDAVNWYIDTYPIPWETTMNKDAWIDAQVVQTWVLFGDPSLKIGGY